MDYIDLHLAHMKIWKSYFITCYCLGPKNNISADIYDIHIRIQHTYIYTYNRYLKHCKEGMEISGSASVHWMLMFTWIKENVINCFSCRKVTGSLFLFSFNDWSWNWAQNFLALIQKWNLILGLFNVKRNKNLLAEL